MSLAFGLHKFPSFDSGGKPIPSWPDPNVLAPGELGTIYFWRGGTSVGGVGLPGIVETWVNFILPNWAYNPDSPDGVSGAKLSIWACAGTPDEKGNVGTLIDYQEVTIGAGQNLNYNSGYWADRKGGAAGWAGEGWLQIINQSKNPKAFVGVDEHSN